MPSFYEDLCRRLKDKGLLQVWERSRAIALAAGIFAIPVNRATEACENWKFKFPDRTWNELRNLLNQGLIVYQDGEFCEIDPDYYYFGSTDNADKIRAIGLACHIFKITPIQAVHASEQFFVNKRRDWEALYHVISGGLLEFIDGEFQYSNHPLQNDRADIQHIFGGVSPGTLRICFFDDRGNLIDEQPYNHSQEYEVRFIGSTVVDARLGVELLSDRSPLFSVRERAETITLARETFFISEEEAAHACDNFFVDPHRDWGGLRQLIRDRQVEYRDGRFSFATSYSYRACQSCAYYYAHNWGQVCNAFHTTFDPNICGDWERK